MVSVLFGQNTGGAAGFHAGVIIQFAGNVKSGTKSGNREVPHCSARHLRLRTPGQFHFSNAQKIILRPTLHLDVAQMARTAIPPLLVYNRKGVMEQRRGRPQATPVLKSVCTRKNVSRAPHPVLPASGGHSPRESDTNWGGHCNQPVGAPPLPRNSCQLSLT
ncbi:hypothetical protein ACJJTC_013128 [Scirpophaga incertulas]